MAPQAAVARDEIFGPVLSVLTVRDEAEAVQVANSVEFGLTAAVWTNDLSQGHRMAAGLDAGYVWINGSARHYWGCHSEAGSHQALDRKNLRRNCCPTHKSRR